LFQVLVSVGVDMTFVIKIKVNVLLYNWWTRDVVMLNWWDILTRVACRNNIAWSLIKDVVMLNWWDILKRVSCRNNIARPLIKSKINWIKARFIIIVIVWMETLVM